MLVADFDYELPQELIAQEPAARRDEARLLVVHRKERRIEDRNFRDIKAYLGSTDLLVLNDTKVIPARLFGTTHGGRRIELLLLREVEPGVWDALSRPSRRAKPGVCLDFGEAYAEVLDWGKAGVRRVRFSDADVLSLLLRKGEVPLPPYIKHKPSDSGRYQTVYAQRDGAVAAPTAGLHFTPELLADLANLGVKIAQVTLHAGLGTFRPVRAKTVEEHSMYPEELEISQAAADSVNQALEEGKRIVAVGTTVVRALESQAQELGGKWRVVPGRKMTSLFIRPGYCFRIVKALLTNFHLPRSTLLMLVSAFADRELILQSYRHAIESRYRFYSFGDAMLIV